MNRRILKVYFLFVFLTIPTICFSQDPIRVGTTTANFLEYGYGSAAIAMGDAYVSMANDLSSIYWNPAGLGYMRQSEVMLMYQPWVVDINTSFVAAGVVLPNIGTLGLSLISANYGDMEVTSLAMQEGTGETFSPNDFAAIFSFGRRIATWFSFGLSAKYISSSIWHTKASAIAADLGVMINTKFFSPDGERGHGLNIGMSVSNYGTRMRYDGVDLINPIDILPNEEGNFRDVPGQFRMQWWELPLIFRVGVSVNPIFTERHRLTLSVDGLHPNNNGESVNTGAEYALQLTSVSKIFLRGGYKALFMQDSQYGLALGGGILFNFLGNRALKIDYAYRDLGIFGSLNNYTISFLF